MRYVERMAHELDPGLPPPVVLVGEAGDKALTINPSFEKSYREVFS